ncbi:glycosyltransferase [Desulfobacula toluolica]|uniref:Glycosyl transferase, family I n=1 Tax=Desulfobacula toluolica (strain DSM 7467 / Tol2) TaxID=651182 RepID=K0NNY2_DESTT|nr:glycosyltransferase [Desulfobacula toluolica]CCK80477.1 glycosyl transferase, family I [Desulfobacula toluolica Tol2]
MYKKLKILFLIELLKRTGGAEQNLYMLSKGLRKRGHIVLISCMKGGELATLMRNDGFFLKDLSLKKINSFNGLKSLFTLVKIIKTKKIDVLVTYHLKSDYLGAVIKFLTGVVVISSRRDMGYNLKSRHIKTYRIINNIFSHIIAVSSAVKNQVVKTQKIKPNIITVIPNGVNFKNFNTSQQKNGDIFQCDISQEYTKICCLANIRPIKGQKYLVEAVNILKKDNIKFHLYFIGIVYDHKGSYYEEILQYIKDNNLENFITFTRNISHEYVPFVLKKMDISVIPSLSEGMSNSVLESMTAGLPVVATGVGGNPECVINGKTGYIVPPKDSVALASAIHKIIMNNTMRKSMSVNSKERIKNHFSEKLLIKNFEKVLFENIIKRKR